MAAVTITNLTTSGIYLSDLWLTLAPSASITVERRPGEIPDLTQTIGLVEAGSVSMSTVYSSTERSAPGKVTISAVDPTANDDIGDGYAPGSEWVNTTSDEVFVCTDNTLASAVWSNTSNAGAGAHAASHTNGSDDIQDATSGQKGLATAAQITKLDGIEALADVTDATNVLTALASAAGDVAVNSQKITGLANPTAGGDAVNKTYGDANYLTAGGLGLDEVEEVTGGAISPAASLFANADVIFIVKAASDYTLPSHTDTRAQRAGGTSGNETPVATFVRVNSLVEFSGTATVNGVADGGAALGDLTTNYTARTFLCGPDGWIVATGV